MIAKALTIHGTFFSPIVFMSTMGNAKKTENISHLGEMPTKNINIYEHRIGVPHPISE